ncbi:hypothetical protein BRD56_00585 [Thermoplasmatales archaeon SW_10_69_26]|nr:MAG: hypothetical protein BRD56_00585 [Thermoplasmatales archaeon SW_10_69_26]
MEDGFEYPGYLLFNEIVHVQEIGFDGPQTIGEELSTFGDGTPTNPSKGFRQLDLSEEVDVRVFETESFAPVVEDMQSFEYIAEDYGTQMEFVTGEGDRQQGRPRSLDRAHIHWHWPDYFFVQGSQSVAEAAAEEIVSELDLDSADVQRFTFDNDFFLWMYKKNHDGDPLSESLDLLKWTDAEATGDLPYLGSSTEVQESEDVGRSIPILVAVLRNMDLASLEGIFEVGSYAMTASIGSQGKVHVKSEQTVQKASNIARVFLSNLFLHELTNLYENWKTLDPEEKYPHPSFFSSLWDNASEQGANLDMDFDRVVEEYAAKRGESAEDYDFDFGN